MKVQKVVQKLVPVVLEETPGGAELARTEQSLTHMVQPRARTA